MGAANTPLGSAREKAARNRAERKIVAERWELR
jgi:hypothetical protein